MLDSLKDSLRDTLTSRLKSSFFGGFILAWLALQWEALYVTFVLSEPPLHPVQEPMCTPNKLSYIAEHLDYGTKTLLIYPAIAALVLPFVIRHLDNMVRTFVEQADYFWNKVAQVVSKKAMVPLAELISERDRFTRGLHDQESARLQLMGSVKTANQTAENLSRQLAEQQGLMEALKRDASHQESAANEARDELARVNKQLQEAAAGLESVQTELKSARLKVKEAEERHLPQRVSTTLAEIQLADAMGKLGQQESLLRSAVAERERLALQLTSLRERLAQHAQQLVNSVVEEKRRTAEKLVTSDMAFLHRVARWLRDNSDAPQDIQDALDKVVTSLTRLPDFLGYIPDESLITDWLKTVATPKSDEAAKAAAKKDQTK